MDLEFIHWIHGNFGGAMGIRTPDLLIANETLYQLSYDPNKLLLNQLRFVMKTKDAGFYAGFHARWVKYGRISHCGKRNIADSLRFSSIISTRSRWSVSFS